MLPLRGECEMCCGKEMELRFGRNEKIEEYATLEVQGDFVANDLQRYGSCHNSIFRNAAIGLATLTGTEGRTMTGFVLLVVVGTL